MMTPTVRIAGALLMTVAAPAGAEVTFQPLASSTHVYRGGGGQRFGRNGIDWWTSGTPSRKFMVVGLVTDDRESLPLSGKAIGSAKVAEVVRRHGGDAVLLDDVRSRPVCRPGQEYSCRGGVVRGHAMGVTLRTTHLVAIRYL